MKEVLLEDIYLESETVFRTQTGEFDTLIRCSLEYGGKKIGKCNIYVPTQMVYDEGIGMFFDEIEEVAIVHYNDIEKSKAKMKRMIKNIIDNERFVYLTSMYVEPEYRNIGVGSLFLDNIVEYLEMSSIENLLLTSGIYEDNDDQNKIDNFYLKYGFDIVNDAGEDGKLMYFKVEKNIYK